MYTYELQSFNNSLVPDGIFVKIFHGLNFSLFVNLCKKIFSLSSFKLKFENQPTQQTKKKGPGSSRHRLSWRSSGRWKDAPAQKSKNKNVKMEYWWHRILGCFCCLFLSTSDVPKTKNLKEELFPFRSCNLIIALQTYKPVQRASRPQCPPLGKCWIKVFF